MEEQQAAAATAVPTDRSEMTPEQRRGEAERKRKVQALELQRERILSERTSSPHRRSALELALADLERMLQELGWTLKL